MNKKKRNVIIIGFSMLIITSALSATGFCIQRMQFLSDREIIDQYLFGKEAMNMPDEGKKHNLENRGMEYPYCCKLSQKKSMFDSRNRELTIVTKGNDEAFKEISIKVNCCGNPVRYFLEDNLIQENISQSKYFERIEKNKE